MIEFEYLASADDGGGSATTAAAAATAGMETMTGASAAAAAAALSPLLSVVAPAGPASANASSFSAVAPSVATIATISVTAVDGSIGGDRQGGPGQGGTKPEPRVLGGREIVDQRGKTRLVGPFYCSVCHKQFPHKSLTEIHLQCHMEKRLPCPFCDKMFKNKYVLKYHVEGAHNQTLGDPSPQLRRRLEKRSLNAVSCFCGLTFETMNSYNEHMRTHQHHPSHNGSNSHNHRASIQQQSHHQAVTCHPCPMCKESFANLYQLVKHMEVHNNNRPALSPEPAVPAKKIRLLGGATLQITPIATSTPQTTATTLTSMLTPTVPPLSLVLPKSPVQKAAGKTSPKVVIAKAVAKPSSLLPTATKQFECEMCGETFTQLPLYRGHLQNAHQLYLICLECHQVAGDVAEMTRHMEIVHPHLTAHPCPVCGRCFTDEEGARNHLEAHKNGLADFSGCFQCAYCEALYDSERECALHEATHPPNARTFLS
ncbi:zinc finger protein 628-like isoform X3 [Varroa destructor]|uniref:C2H2-type domain-containing protein n=1 Tax=Varroa destructor TaxID=109461 RepID=A0A7M7J8C4_VARDE|nr:zinc finger protein 628-like isoform X3 [Varroa destructor]